MQQTGNRPLANKIVVLSTAIAAGVAILFLIVTGEWDGRYWLLASAITMGAAGLAFWMTRRLLSEPLEQLHHALNVASRGGSWCEPARPAADELGRLNQSVGRIVEALERSQEEVRQQKSLLEQKVLRRTSELERRTERAEGSMIAQREFLANMALDLRQPVNGALGTIDIVLDTRLTPEQREQLETAQRCAYSALALLNDVVDLSRIEAGKMTLDRSPVILNEILDNCIRALHLRMGDKHASITSLVDPSVPRRLMGDPLRTRQVIWHVLNAALRLSSGGDVRVVAKAKEMAGMSSRSEVSIEIRYTGEGVEDELYADKPPTAGSLGLSISCKLAEMLGGEIRSIQEDKTRVIAVRLLLEVLELPAAARTQQSPGTATSGMPQGNGTSPADVSAIPAVSSGIGVLAPNGGAKILVAEDTIVNQKVITAVLKKRGYRVVVAGDGKEAIRIVENSLYDDPVQLIVMDVQMPVMDGLEATRALRQTKEWKDLPIVAMTAHSMSGDRDRCLEAGMTGYIPKPVNAALLVQTIEEQLAGVRGLDALRLEAATRSLDSYSDISQGLYELFMQVAPDRVRRLNTALEAGDRSTIQSEARKVAAGAERIHADQVSGIARRIETKAPYLEAVALREELDMLSNALKTLSVEKVPS